MTFTEKEANLLIKYYSEKIIGQPIMEHDKNSNPILIDSLDKQRLGDDEYKIFCYGQHLGNAFRKTLHKVVPELEVISIQELLKGLNQ